jgi:hypothetical protein
MSVDLLRQFDDRLGVRLRREHDRGHPLARGEPAAMRERHDALDLGRHLHRRGHVGLVDREHVAISMIPAFIACTTSPASGGITRISVSTCERAASSALPDADRLDDHLVEAVLVHRLEQLVQVVGEAVGGRARAERADVEILGAREVVHPDSVAEDRTAGLRARRVDREDAEPAAIDARQREASGERALPRAGRAGDADAPGARRRCGGCVGHRARACRGSAGVRDSRERKAQRAPVQRRARRSGAAALTLCSRCARARARRRLARPEDLLAMLVEQRRRAVVRRRVAELDRAADRRASPRLPSPELDDEIALLRQGRSRAPHRASRFRDDDRPAARGASSSSSRCRWRARA